jgi:hypothetical protein
MFGLASLDPSSTSSREANAPDPKAVWILVEKGDDASALVVGTEHSDAREISKLYRRHDLLHTT